ncbi:MAG: serine/threonine-protein kinase, partial [Pseudomonadota bacterium]
MTSIAEALEAGSRIGPVVLEAAIDRGGYGIVYRGQHDTLGPVAIKEFFPRMVASRSRSSNQIIHSGSRSDAQAFEKGLQKFLTEAHVLEKLDHPNVVKFHEVIEANGTAYLVMNFVAGKTLGDFIVQNSEEIDDRFSQRVAVDIAGALDALHAEGIIHQDVAPDNIIIEQTTNRPILIDFGGAKQVVHGYTQHSEEALIKRGFSPPEHFPKGDVKGLERGPWSDLYGLSAVLYNLVAAKPPPDSISRVEFDRLIPTKNVGSDRATQALLEAIDWGLKVSPQKRPQTVFEWLEVAEGTSRPSFKIALPKVQIDPKVFAAIAAVLVLAVVGTGIVQLVTALNDNWAFNQAMTGDCVSARSYISKQKERSADPGLLQISQWCDARDQ